MFDFNHIAAEVTEALSEFTDEYDIKGITEEIRDTTSYTDVDDIPSDEFWDIVLNHTK